MLWRVFASLPLGAATGIIAGASGTRWGTTVLPLDLRPFGMPGCFLRVSYDVVVPLSNQNGTAAFDLLIPLNPALVGRSFYNQGFATAPSANSLGLILTKAAAVSIGAR